MIDRWLQIHDDSRLAFLSPARRVTVANAILLAEAQGGYGPEPYPPTPTPTRWFEVTDFGMQSEEWLRAKLRLENHPDWNLVDIDTIMVDFSLVFGKTVTPLDPAVPPFYLINGVRESIYKLRLRVKALYIDEWNTADREYVVARLRANGDTVQPL